MSDLRKNCNQGQQKQTLRISSPPRLLDRPKTPACLGLTEVNLGCSLMISRKERLISRPFFSKKVGAQSSFYFILPKNWARAHPAF